MVGLQLKGLAITGLGLVGVAAGVQQHAVAVVQIGFARFDLYGMAQQQLGFAGFGALTQQQRQIVQQGRVIRINRKQRAINPLGLGQIAGELKALGPLQDLLQVGRCCARGHLFICVFGWIVHG